MNKLNFYDVKADYDEFDIHLLITAKEKNNRERSITVDKFGNIGRFKKFFKD